MSRELLRPHGIIGHRSGKWNQIATVDSDFAPTRQKASAMDLSPVKICKILELN